MGRPKTKIALLELSFKNFVKLKDLVDSFTPEERTKEFPVGTMNRNIRDVLAHLHHWDLLMLEWYAIGMKGQKPDMPAKGYTWKTISDLNHNIQKQYQSIDLHLVRSDLNSSFKRLQELIKRHTDEELFEKKHYPWTGSTSLGAYFISATSSHYDWAYKLIRKAKK